MPTPHNLFTTALHAVTTAGDLALRMASDGFDSWDKSPGNPCTSADLAVDHLLRARLPQQDIGWLSEESAASPNRLAATRLWVVDPIDGTRDYARRRPGWAISLALVEHGAPTMAFLYAPAQQRLYTARAGHGATLNDQPITVSGRRNPAAMRLPVDPQLITSRLWPEPWDAVAVAKPNSIALRIALVAGGDADALFDGRTTNEWDVAAASLILQEAGGTITDRTGAPFAFNQATPTLPGLVAATPALHAEALDRLAFARAALDRAGIRTDR
ncbi:3'(2'),5'-bisphosphate nucleotidase CysQ [Sandaracinobacteroides saxicola]|uniref:3'(2'),5'-bisphosphate nucleotidase CysQ n=1 Tax=Sandaracinobacteroides saxicola TaxID=2759707 RepID=A0A7G5ILT7_9SPHN|nr:3'(2'),5'-bisphosphate nucleotidase CysQ [Sandaracinobacteroides saxicola]QMW24329.1 3'(2'),5'-bisphosphate nucleotidase CysQ [Sandaracinobacteroides saxicola]